MSQVTQKKSKFDKHKKKIFEVDEFYQKMWLGSFAHSGCDITSTFGLPEG